MLKTPWRPRVEVSPLFRPRSPSPSALMIRLACAKDDGCWRCTGREIKPKEKKKKKKRLNGCGHNGTRWGKSGEKTFLTCRHLVEGISVGLQADFHHLERVHDDSFRQASAQAGHRERLQGRQTGCGGQSVKKNICLQCQGKDCLPQVTHEDTFYSLKGENSRKN